MNLANFVYPRAPRRLAVVAVALACVVGFATCPAHAVELETIAPPDGIVYLRASNLAQLVPKAKKHAAYKMWLDVQKDKSVAPFVEAFRKGLNKSLSSEGGDSLDETVGRVEKILALLGETLICTYLTEDDSGEMPILVLARVAAKDYPEYLRLGEQFHKDREKRQTRKIEFLGESIEEEAPGEGDKTPSFHAFVNGVSIDSNSLDLTKRAVHNLKKGGGDSLKSAGEYTRAVGELARRTDLQIYMSLKAVLEKAEREAEARDTLSPAPPSHGHGHNGGPPPPSPAEVKKMMIDLSGVKDLNWIAMGLALEERQTELEVFCSVTPGQNGFWKLLPRTNVPVPRPGFVSGDVASFVFARVGLLEFLEEFERIMQKAYPSQYAGYVGGLAMARAQIGVDVKNDIVGNLGNDFYLYNPPPESTPEEGREAHGVAVLSLKDDAAILKAVSKLLNPDPSSGQAVPLHSEDYMGEKIYYVLFPCPGCEGDLKSSAFSFMVSRRSLVLGAYPDVKEFVRGWRATEKDSSFFDSSSFRSVAKVLPDRLTAMWYANLKHGSSVIREVSREILGELDRGPIVDSPPGQPDAFMARAEEKNKAADALVGLFTNYFQDIVAHARWTPDGLSAKVVVRHKNKR